MSFCGQGQRRRRRRRRRLRARERRRRLANPFSLYRPSAAEAEAEAAVPARKEGGEDPRFNDLANFALDGRSQALASLLLLGPGGRGRGSLGALNPGRRLREGWRETRGAEAEAGGGLGGGGGEASTADEGQGAVVGGSVAPRGRGGRGGGKGGDGGELLNIIRAFEKSKEENARKDRNVVDTFIQ